VIAAVPSAARCPCAKMTSHMSQISARILASPARARNEDSEWASGRPYSGSSLLLSSVRERDASNLSEKGLSACFLLCDSTLFAHSDFLSPTELNSLEIRSKGCKSERKKTRCKINTFISFSFHLLL
jgi:hypothetical protein